tara:strand:+ start:745 stop:969 length:225 start_codon:yes stop_codon:yes gene_type:complete
MTLYDKLKPHIKNKLDSYAEEYSISIRYIYDKLKTNNRYSDLTVDDVKTIHTFSDIFYNDISGLELLYGDHLFN